MRTLCLFVVLTSIAAAPLAAQSESEVDAYYTLLGTPAGSLTPTLSSAMLGQTKATSSVALRYGHIFVARTDFKNLGATLGIPVGPRAQVGITGEYQTLSCDISTPDSTSVRRRFGYCGRGHLIAGANAEVRLTSMTLGAGAYAPRLTIGVNGEGGFAKPVGTNLFSLTGSVPIAVVVGGPNISVAPFVTPALGWGQASVGSIGDSNNRYMLGGGLSVQSSARRLAANVGFQRVVFDGAATVIGVTLVFGQ